MDNANNLEAALNVLLNSNKQKPVVGPPPRGTVHTLIQRISDGPRLSFML